MLAVTACGGDVQPHAVTAPSPPQSNSAAGTTTSTTAKPEPTASSIVGPVFYHCPVEFAGGDARKQVEVYKLDLSSAKLVPIAQYQALGCSDVAGPTFGFGYSYEKGTPRLPGQIARFTFSPDYQKVALTQTYIQDALHVSNTHAGYYDLKLDRVIDVTAIVAPSTGDFDAQPDHQYGYFTADGLFAFHDWKTDLVNYFDTNTQKVVRTSPNPELAPWIESLQRVEGDNTYDRTCNAAWMLDGGRYVRFVRHSGDEEYRIVSLSDAPEPGSSECETDDTVGSRITPVAYGLHTSAVAGDPSGSTVIFVFAGHNGTKLYKANLADPDHPTEVPQTFIAGDYDDWNIIDWS